MTRSLQLTRFERMLLSAACLCFALYGLDTARVSAFQQIQRAAFERGPAVSHPEPGISAGSQVGKIDIPNIHLSAMVIEGDDDRTLAHAVGHLADTPLPWESGNSVMAGHRDTFFRPLRNIKIGDRITLGTERGSLTYSVDDIRIVAPEDVSVLAPTSRSVLTLVTCYPFDYIGAAPKRFIVRAQRLGN